MLSLFSDMANGFCDGPVLKLNVPVGALKELFDPVLVFSLLLDGLN